MEKTTGDDHVPEVSAADPYLVETILKDLSDLVRSIDDAQGVMNQVAKLTTRLLRVRNCSLVMIEDDNETMRMGAAHGLPEGVLEKYRGRVGEGITGHVAKTGKPLLIEDVETHPLFARKSRKKYSTKSLLSVPLIFQESIIGVLNVNNRNDNSIFTHSDELLLSVLANFVVIAIEKAQMRERIRETERYEADLRVAREIQESLLPSELPSLKRWQLAARNIPAREVAGDFYDAIPLPEDRLCVVLGDVCGKGVPAAVYMSRVMGYFRVGAQVHYTAGEIMSFVNALLAPEWTERTFVTAVILVFDNRTGKVSFCSAGHQDPLYVTTGGTVQSVASGEGLPLGVLGPAVFGSTELDTSPGDTFVIYTDGVTEAQNPQGDMFREQRLKDLLKSHSGTVEQLVESIVAAVDDFAGGAPQSDDVTVVAIRRI